MPFTCYLLGMISEASGAARSIETISTSRHCAAVSPTEGVGVAVGEAPSCGDQWCPSCAVVLWSDMGTLSAELQVLGLVVVKVLPGIPGQRTRYLIGEAPESCWDEDGFALTPWSPDGLPVYSEGAQRIHLHPALPSLWAAMADLLAELDGLAAEGLGERD